MVRSKGTITTIDSHTISAYAICHDAWSAGRTVARSATSGSRSATSCGTNLTIVL